MKGGLISLMASAVLAAVSTAGADGHTQYGSFGLDLAAGDRSVRPGDDFYRYANGHWLDTQKIPADRARWGPMDEVAELTDERVNRLIEQLPPDAPAGSLEQKVGDYYRAFVDQAAIDAAGLEPARPGLDAIAAAKSHADIATLMGRPDLNLDAPIGIGISTDEKNPDRYIAVMA